MGLMKHERDIPLIIPVLKQDCDKLGYNIQSGSIEHGKISVG